MATLKQTEAIMRIYKRFNKEISFDEAIRWPKARAWKFINQNYLSYYDVMREIKERNQNEKAEGDQKSNL